MDDELNDLIIDLSEMIQEDCFFAISSNGDMYKMKALGFSDEISRSLASAMFAVPELANMVRSALQRYDVLQN